MWLLRLGPARLGRNRSRPALTGFLAAHLGMLVLFLPWLARVPHQWELIEVAGPTWMTPATGRNLFFTVAYWLPFGRLGVPDEAPFRAWLLLGVAALVVPLAAAAATALRRRRGAAAPERVPAAPAQARQPASVLRAAASLGLGATLLFVLVLWGADRAGLAHVFHGPRYPLLAAGPWAGGLAALALLSTRRRVLPA